MRKSIGLLNKEIKMDAVLYSCHIEYRYLLHWYHNSQLHRKSIRKLQFFRYIKDYSFQVYEQNYNNNRLVKQAGNLVEWPRLQVIKRG